MLVMPRFACPSCRWITTSGTPSCAILTAWAVAVGGREPPSHAGGRGRVMQLFARGRRFPTSSRGRSVDHAQHRADRELVADLEPGVELVPRPTVHPDLSALAALSTSDECSVAGAIEVALLERERFADPQPGAP